MTEPQILADYPDLEAADLRAAIAYADDPILFTHACRSNTKHRTGGGMKFVVDAQLPAVWRRNWLRPAMTQFALQIFPPRTARRTRKLPHWRSGITASW